MEWGRNKMVRSVSTSDWLSANNMSLFIITFLYLSSVFCVLEGKNRSPGGGCPLPEKSDNGDYEVSDCVDGDFSSKCRKVPGTIVSQFVVLIYSCNLGFALSVDIKHSLCNNGTWDPEPPDCLKLCNGLSSNLLDLKCFYYGSKVDCGQPARPGTELRAKCKDTYHVSDPSASFSIMQCSSDGTWTNELYKCVPDCGIRNKIDATPTIKGEPLLDQSEFPWHAGLYQSKGHEIVNLCGGTIIHPKAVLIAAHCVYNDTTHSKVDEKEIYVAIGKYRSNWNIKETTEQKFRVTQIIIGDKFAGFSNRYEHDIAILELDRFIIFNAAVMPICFDRGDRLSLYKGSNALGTVVSWGPTETSGIISDILTVARFQVLGFHDCLEKANKSIFITYDKFCAKLSNDTNLKKEDSGNALTFPRFNYGDEQHFIYGIFSLKEGNATVLFTNVTEHMKWIDKVLDMIV